MVGGLIVQEKCTSVIMRMIGIMLILLLPQLYAEEKAMQDSWVRGSWFNKKFFIEWHYDLTPKTSKKLLDWVNKFGGAFSEIIIIVEEDEYVFDDFKKAVSFIKNQT